MAFQHQSKSLLTGGMGSVISPAGSGSHLTLTEPYEADKELLIWLVAVGSKQWLIASPYTEVEHLLDPSQLELQDFLLALALTQLISPREDYATCPYENALDWRNVMKSLLGWTKSSGTVWRRREYYVVEFRSRLKPDVDSDLLYRLDKESHGEAMQSGGLLKYWYGAPDSQRRNLATCLWRSKEDAIKGGRGPWHKQAMAVIPKMYEDICVKGLRLVVEDNVQEWQFSSFAPERITGRP